MVTDHPVSSIDFQQQRGRHADIIAEALATYDEWMLDDDYEAMAVLHKIMKRMRERSTLTDKLFETEETMRKAQER